MMPSSPLTLLAAGALAVIGSAQTTATATVSGERTTIVLPYFIQPTGVQDSRGSLSGSLPLICTSICYGIEIGYGCVSVQSPSLRLARPSTGCSEPAGVSRQAALTDRGCFLDYKTPYYYNSTGYHSFDYTAEVCADFLCGAEQYQVFAQCMNCIVANGGEAPRSTQVPLQSGGLDRGAAANERIDQERANGWLRNVTDFCTARGSAVEGAQSVTATPTTTYVRRTQYERGSGVLVS